MSENISVDDDLNAWLFSCFSVCLYFMYENNNTIAPTATNNIPVVEDEAHFYLPKPMNMAFWVPVAGNLQ